VCARERERERDGDRVRGAPLSLAILLAKLLPAVALICYTATATVTATASASVCPAHAGDRTRPDEFGRGGGAGCKATQGRGLPCGKEEGLRCLPGTRQGRGAVERTRATLVHLQATHSSHRRACLALALALSPSPSQSSSPSVPGIPSLCIRPYL
jgi:hypothetical protein